MQIQRQLIHESIDKSGAWGYFDGASQSTPTMCGAGGIIFLSEVHLINLKAGLGGGSHNYAELLALKLLMKLAAKKGVTRSHVFGDSLVVLNWMNGKFKMGNLVLSPIFEQMKIIRQCLIPFPSSMSTGSLIQRQTHFPKKAFS